MEKKIKCHCGSELMVYKEVTFRNGTKHIQRSCAVCNAHYDYAPSVDDSHFRMPFGKYKGVFLSTVPRDYIDWLLTRDIRRNIRERIVRVFKIEENKYPLDK